MLLEVGDGADVTKIILPFACAASLGLTGLVRGKLVQSCTSGPREP